MTLLAYMSKADEPPPGCARLAQLINELGQRFPGAFFIPMTVEPPRTTRPWIQQDWVTIPKSMSVAERANLVATTARWFEATVVLFLGSSAKADWEAFVTPAGCRKLYWDDAVWHGADGRAIEEGFAGPLDRTLQRGLPMIGSVRDLVTNEFEQAFQASRTTECPIWIYLRKPLAEMEVAALVSLSNRHPAHVHLKVSLRTGLGSFEGLRRLRRLLEAGPALRFTVIAENTWFEAAARAMTKLLAAGAGPGVQPVLAPKL